MSYCAIILAAVVGLGAKLVYDKIDDWKVERELVIWDYVKKHPQDFPEVFNRKFFIYKV